MNLASTDQIGKFLEKRAREGKPINYAEVIRIFPGLPPLNGNWSSHPLAQIFGDLDREDFANGRPFRTALVFALETSIPGDGFFKTLSDLRRIEISNTERSRLWIDEVNAVIAHYQA
jgi:hypothetical protein